MDLSDWYRYVDRVSRPAGREGGPSPAPAEPDDGWRPWLPQEAREEERTETVEAPQPTGAIPDLASLLANRPLGVSLPELLPTTPPQPAAPAEPYQDLTVYDELPPLPEYERPALRPPGFEVTVPALEPVPPDPGPSRLEEAPPARTSAAAGPPPEWLNPHARRELLARLLGERPDAADALAEGGEENGRSRGETREELLERLVDPVLTLEQTALILQVCPTTVRRYTNKKLLAHFRTKGNQRRFRFSDVMEFLQSREAEIRADSLADRQAVEQGRDPSREAA